MILVTTAPIIDWNQQTQTWFVKRQRWSASQPNAWELTILDRSRTRAIHHYLWKILRRIGWSKWWFLGKSFCEVFDASEGCRWSRDTVGVVSQFHMQKLCMKMPVDMCCCISWYVDMNEFSIQATRLWKLNINIHFWRWFSFPQVGYGLVPCRVYQQSSHPCLRRITPSFPRWTLRCWCVGRWQIEKRFVFLRKFHPTACPIHHAFWCFCLYETYQKRLVKIRIGIWFEKKPDPLQVPVPEAHPADEPSIPWGRQTWFGVRIPPKISCKNPKQTKAPEQKRRIVPFFGNLYPHNCMLYGIHPEN